MKSELLLLASAAFLLGQAGFAFFFLRSFREGENLHAAYRRHTEANQPHRTDSRAQLAGSHEAEENTGDGNGLRKAG